MKKNSIANLFGSAYNYAMLYLGNLRKITPSGRQADLNEIRLKVIPKEKSIKHEKLKFIQNFKIQKRLMTSFLLVSFVPLSVLGLISYRNSDNAIKQKIITYSTQVVDGIKNNIDLELNKYKYIGNQLSIMKEMNDNLNTITIAENEDKAVIIQNIQHSMEMWSQSIDGLESIILNLSGGETINLGSARFVDPYEKFKDIIAEAEQSNGSVKWVYRKNNDEGTTTGKFTLTLFKGIKSSITGDVVATLIIQVNQQYFSDMFSKINVGEGAKRFLIAGDGTILASAEKEIIPGTKLSDVGLLKKVDKNAEQKNRYFDYKIGKTGYLLAYAYNRDIDAYSIIAVPHSYLNKEISKIKINTIIICIIFFIAALLLSLIITKSISSPLSILIKHMRMAREGNLAIKLNNADEDELGEAARNFDEMLNNIRMLIECVRSSSNDVTTHSQEIASISELSYLSSEQVAAAAQQLAEGATEQAKNVVNTAEFMDNLSDRLNKVGQSMEKVSNTLQYTIEQSRMASLVVKDLNDKAVKVNEATIMSVSNINELGTDMKKIKSIVKMIVSIAEQTNLLSLNAAIEAARAGDAGKGFAVVAAEVKKLADQSKDASISISNIINNIEMKTERTVENAHITKSIISAQMDVVQKTDNVFKSISNAVENTSSNINVVAEAIFDILERKEKAVESINHISIVAQQTASTAEETSASTQEQMNVTDELSSLANKLRDMAGELNEAVSKFVIDY